MADAIRLDHRSIDPHQALSDISDELNLFDGSIEALSMIAHAVRADEGINDGKKLSGALWAIHRERTRSAAISRRLQEAGRLAA